MYARMHFPVQPMGRIDNGFSTGALLDYQKLVSELMESRNGHFGDHLINEGRLFERINLVPSSLCGCLSLYVKSISAKALLESGCLF
jgi:hypothetical protein